LPIVLVCSCYILLGHDVRVRAVAIAFVSLGGGTLLFFSLFVIRQTSHLYHTQYTVYIS